MKKNLFLILIFFGIFSSKAQSFGLVNEILDEVENRLGLNEELESVSIEGKKFIHVKDLKEVTNRFVLSFEKDLKISYIELMDDKKTGETKSKIYTGDVRRKKNFVSIRADILDGKKIPLSVTKLLLITKQKDILYLIDANNGERWIDEDAFKKK